MKKIKLYLDVDGVLLTAKNTGVPEHAHQFIDFVLENFECFWLTTHCKGNNNSVLKYLQPYYNDKYIQKLSKVISTNWDALKTEAIDFRNEFIWMEDAPFQAEIKVLEKYGKENNLVLVNLNYKDELLNKMKFLKSYI